MGKHGVMLGACVAALASCVLASCAWHVPGLACADTDMACLERSLASNPVRSLDFWKADRARPLAERIGPAPPQLVDFITVDNIRNGYPERPRAAAMDAGFTQDLRDALAELPAEVRRLFDQRLVGICLVDSLGGTGYTDSVLDAQGKQVAGMVVLDASVLKQHSANGWATWKENTPFRKDEHFRLQALIEHEAQDNRKNAIQYILLHELGHVLAIGGTIHPSWNDEPKDVGATAEYGYFNLSWKIDTEANKYVTLFDSEFAQRRNVAYYLGAKLGAQDMVPTYASLVKTNFPSLYAATHPADDFAEAFASYVHVVLMHRPWRITLSRGAEVVAVVDSCWEEARCAAKRKLLEHLLRQPD